MSLLSWLSSLSKKPNPTQTPIITNPPKVGSKPDFDLAFERLIGHEGKFQNMRSDRGNWTHGKVGIGELKGTKYGISAMTYPHLDIENLTLEEAKKIYYSDFWIRAGADQYDGAIGYQVFDAAVNHGIGNAIRFLQQAVNVVDDGDIGPITLEAIKNSSLTDILMRFNAARLRFYTKLSTWNDYGKGWVNRIAGNLDFGAKDA